MLPEAPDEDSSAMRWAPWLTQRRLVLFVIGWLTLFAVIGAFVSNPFQSETSAGAGPDYAHVMFLHGLLIGMVGLMALLTCQVFRMRSTHVRLWIAGGVFAATILSAVGGIFDKAVPGYEVPMWTQILSFFALDEILLMLLYGMLVEWRRSTVNHTLPYIAGALAAGSMFLAALMGHLAGWILEFGWNNPPIIKDFATFAGFGSQDGFTGALIGSHSHDMAVGAMALAIALLAQQFGYATLRGASQALARIGLGLVAIGVAVMTVMYVAMALSQWGPPTLFQSADGTNGIAGDDVITGTLVMGGGVLVVAAFALLRTVLRQPVRVAALWAWVLSFATVVVAGFAIEMNETFFGAGDPTAAGARNDAVFTWLHQDLGLFLLPALVLVMLAVDRLVTRLRRGVIGWATIVGTTVAFLGGLVWVFVNPDLHGPGYIVSTVGVIFIGTTLLATLWYGAPFQALRPTPAKTTLPPFESTLEPTAPLWHPVTAREVIPSEPAMPTAPAPEKVPIGAGSR
jgi:hypothetical protein